MQPHSELFQSLGRTYTFTYTWSVSQITFYLDEATEAQVRKAAEEAGVSLSRWVAEVLREKLADEWPQSVVDLAGAWKDFPTREEIDTELGSDLPRESL